MTNDWNGNCHRCGKSSISHIMSIFCEELLCPNCRRAERKHPRHDEANKAVDEAFKSGKFDYPGIGKPSDL